ncbi:flagellar basal-body rod protein FlgG [Thermosediminibacter oceani]|uniref:Flagellar basal-body rod protein FlgG n=1 Tax=Thermosediminibacter oceani (strain ATCC BAA-1034 / DSM 16646 / JW/IW-1228P) TaxID=555079 RepID=D9RZV4_THEOJ|nr:flagellar basal-body rod protein FlgG [Thermosediminibacter oceani]ADL08731.1 flagellar basal-body rod protein FlgG [Thermosediminibacter oceani DSM 16646]
MMRALWSASSGMLAQQLNVDVISNNLANVNTTGYKKSRVEFKDLLYETLRRPDVFQPGQGNPVGLQVGHGVRPASTTRFFTEGNLQQTGNTFDLAIEGEGFFVVERPDGSRAFTRDGSFKVSIDGDDRYLVTSEGYYVLDTDEDYISIPEDLTDINISANGTITGRDADGNIEEIGTIALARFLNPEGLLAVGNNLFEQTAASGEYQLKEDPNEPGFGTILQGFLEMSNVQVVDEMVNLIVAQRAYEINTKAIQTADEMLGQANNLRR